MFPEWIFYILLSWENKSVFANQLRLLSSERKSDFFNFLDSAAKQDISANTENRADFDYAGNKDFIVKFSIQYWCLRIYFDSLHSVSAHWYRLHHNL